MMSDTLESIATNVVQLSAGSEGLAREVRESAGERAMLSFVLDCTVEAPDDPWTAWVANAGEQVLLQLSQAARAGTRMPTILGVVRTSGLSTWRGAIESAALETLHGTLGAAALELAPDTRANLVVIDPHTDAGDLRHTIRFLLDDEVGGYTTGATVRLTGEWGPELQAPTGARGRRDARFGRALVTGAAGGIGFATAQAFARAGYHVIAADIDQARLAVAAAELHATPLILDVTSREALRAALQSEALAGGLQALAIAHGVLDAMPLRDTDERVIRRNLGINSTAVALIVEELLPALRQGAPSSIAIVASQAGIKAEAQLSAYCASKFAVVGLVRGLAPVLIRDDIRIHALCPGPVDTRLLAGALSGFAKASGTAMDQFREQRAAGIPLRRFGAPHEMAAALLLLTQLEKTGVVLAPTGGETLT